MSDYLNGLLRVSFIMAPNSYCYLMAYAEDNLNSWMVEVDFENSRMEFGLQARFSYSVCKTSNRLCFRLRHCDCYVEGRCCVTHSLVASSPPTDGVAVHARLLPYRVTITIVVGALQFHLAQPHQAPAHQNLLVLSRFTYVPLDVVL